MSTPQTPVDLPDLAPARIDAIEDRVFAGIARERRRGRIRRRVIGGAVGAAAALVVVAAVISPGVVASLDPTTSAGDAAVSAPGVGGRDLDSGTRMDSYAGSAGGAESAPADAAPPDGEERVETISATATLVVADPADAAEEIGAAAAERGGHVESVSVGTGGERIASDGTVVPPAPPTDGWITVRVPSDQLPAAVAELSAFGEVEASALHRQDVTQESIDLRARVDAAQTSVDRLTALLAEAGSIGDLLAAESALAERQANLDSWRQQLAWLEGQVAMSSLTVTLVTEPAATPVEADPAGFGDGLAAGWNGLVATLNGIVLGLGFLLPWLGVAAVAALLVWAVVALRRRPRSRGPRRAEDERA